MVSIDQVTARLRGFEIDIDYSDKYIMVIINSAPWLQKISYFHYGTAVGTSKEEAHAAAIAFGTGNVLRG